MKLLHKYDENGLYIEDVMVDMDDMGRYDVPDRCTEVPPPQPSWKPVFDSEKNEWIETITQEELEELQKPSERPLTDTEVLGQQMTERELEAMVQGQQITDLEIEAMLQGQQMTDFEIRLLEMEAKGNV